MGPLLYSPLGQTVPLFKNASCSNQLVWNNLPPTSVDQGLKASAWLILALLTIGANALWVIILRHDRYPMPMSSQSRLILTACGTNAIFTGLVLLLPATFTSLLSCWLFGMVLCQVQAVVQSALGQNFVMVIILLSLDRLWCLKKPGSYGSKTCKNLFKVSLVLSLVFPLFLFGLVVVFTGSFFFNVADTSSLPSCQPYWGPSSSYMRILSSCLFYFVPTLTLMYCYGSLFHATKFQKPSRSKPASTSLARLGRNVATDQLKWCMEQGAHLCQESDASDSLAPSLAMASQNGVKGSFLPEGGGRLCSSRMQDYDLARTTAAMSLGFVIAVTPATVQEVIFITTGAQLSPPLDFFISWLGRTYLLWNPLLFTLFQARFRMAVHHFFTREIICRRASAPPCCPEELHQRKARCQTSQQGHDHLYTPKIMYPLPPARAGGSREPSSIEAKSHEEHWGDILERSASLMSLPLGLATSSRS